MKYLSRDHLGKYQACSAEYPAFLIKPELLVSGPVRQALVHAALPHQDQDGLSGRRLDEASHCVLSLSLSLSLAHKVEVTPVIVGNQQ